jgi:hypothetical protein
MRTILILDRREKLPKVIEEMASKISMALNKEVKFYSELVKNSVVPVPFGDFNEVHEEDPGLKVELDDIDLQSIVNSLHVKLIITSSVDEGQAGSSMFSEEVQTVVDSVHCPVLLFPPGVSNREIKKIGFASDLMDLNHELSQVVSFARTFNSEIGIFHIYMVLPEIGNVARINMREKIELLKKINQYANINYNIEEMPMDNEINMGINKFLEERKIDMLTIFHQKGQPLDKHFSSGRYKKGVPHLNVPVLVFEKK